MSDFTEKQERFLELLFQDGLPDDLMARAEAVKQDAGYSKETRVYNILRPLKQEIIERNLEYMALYSSESIGALQSVVRTPTQLGADTKIKAANSLLDRSGLGKKETFEVDVKAEKGIVILPAKIE